jgi:hypothetical protein
MALPSSGTLSLTDIKAAIPSSSNSLKQVCIDAGFTASFSMSQFYGYSGGTVTSYPQTYYVLK